MAGSEGTASGVKSESLRSALGAIGLFSSVFFLNFVGRVIISPLMPAVQKDLTLDHSQAGGLFLFISLGYCATLLASGWVTALVTHRRAIFFSAVAVGVALIGSAAGQGLWSLRISLFVIGAAGGLYLPSAIATITTLLEPKDWGKGLGVHELAPNLSFSAAPLLAGLFLNWFTWREVLVGLGVAGLVLAVVFARWGRGGDFKSHRPDVANLGQVIRRPGFWPMCALFCLGVGSSMGVFSMLPLYMVTEQGWSTQEANYLVGLTRVSGLFMGFMGGWFSDRLGPAKALAYIMGSTGVLTIILGLTQGWLLIVLAFAQPAMAVCFFAPAFAAIGRYFLAEDRSLAVSLIVGVAIAVGGGLLPAFTGHLAKAGYFGLGFTIIGALIFSGLLAIIFLPRQAKESPAE